MDSVRKTLECQCAYKGNYLGQGIGIAILDTGVCGHPDLGNRIVAFKDFVNNKQFMYDDNGHGTHIAGIIGGSGLSSGGTYMGMAPACHFIIGKVLNSRGNGKTSDVLNGIDWVIENKECLGIRILNISVGANSQAGPLNKEKGSTEWAEPSCEAETRRLLWGEEDVDESRLIKAVERAWDSGLVVVVAAGNNGPRPMTVTIPGTSRKVITVGCSDDNVPVRIKGSLYSDYSGRGPTLSCIKKPDLVAPGSNIVSLQSGSYKNGRLVKINGSYQQKFYTKKSGTSMATPIVSGGIALLLSKYPRMNNLEVKIKLMKTANDLNQPWSKQGWGIVNVKDLLE